MTILSIKYKNTSCVSETQMFRLFHKNLSKCACADAEVGGGGWGFPGARTPPPSWNFDKTVVIGFVNGTGLILHSIYVKYNPN